ncbi:MAG: hypothetical protein RMN52_03440 [Anaerolineae bacterium]|nr:hypothetical protein [Candidatus Roseilinea sp.]MDW8449034.1 hypothetical protein [Anaerolineae bacterium]
MIPASNLLGIAAGIVALVALLIFLNAIWVARWARRAAYYGVRRDAQRTANRRLTLAISVFALAGVLLVTSWIVPRETAQPPPLSAARAEAGIGTATASLEPATAIPDVTPVVATTTEDTPPIQPTSLPTLQPTSSATPIPEPTSALVSPVATPANGSTAAGEAQIPPDKRLVLNAIAIGVDANGAPIGAGTTFTRGVETIYIFFDFRDVPPSALLRHSWFRDGGSVFFRSKRLAKNGQGTDYVSWSPPGGFQPGLYEVRIALGGVPQFVANFEVR